jgi:hypothetical protein
MWIGRFAHDSKRVWQRAAPEFEQEVTEETDIFLFRLCSLCLPLLNFVFICWLRAGSAGEHHRSVSSHGS